MKPTLYRGFFENELTNRLLFFWLPRCMDEENGGYLNCFTNDGSRLVSKDKYTWSQGRFLWTFSKLSMMKGNLFTEDEKKRFLEMAKNGRDFLYKNVLIPGETMRCAFLMEADGAHKRVEGHEGYDLSIFADCFVVLGFAAYALASGDRESWIFARELGESVWSRYASGDYRLLPYPLSAKYRSHSKPMILTNVCCELYRTAEVMEPEACRTLSERIRACRREVFEEMADERGLVHEFKYAKGDFPQDLFGQHINPGHTLEDLWFQLDASEILGDHEYDESIRRTACATFELGWDDEFGGLYHFIPCDGLQTAYGDGEAADEPQLSLVKDDWGSKLWWVHSEALYVTARLYLETKDPVFLSYFERVFDYTYKTFPNPDPNIREWIQIRTREGAPQDKVVALPVKDPYHIIRNVILLIELFEKYEKNQED